MSSPDNKPYRLIAFKEFVPEPIRFWIYIIFGIIFHLSGGIYVALSSQMVGSFAILQEDVMFLGASAFTGMTIIFPILFRLKFRFTNKTLLLTSALGLIICNIIPLITSFMPVLVVVCFFAGLFRMVGFFECMSTVQLKITPTRDFAKFFPVVYLLVLGCIQISGITAGYISYFYRWDYMYLLAVGMLSLVALGCMFLFRHIRTATPEPLTGIDWLGALLWSLLIMLIIFILIYGEHYDWMDSVYIRFALISALLTFSTIFIRTRYIRYPYIDLHAFSYRIINYINILFVAMCVLLSTSNVLQNAYTGGILHYDMLSVLSLNLPVLAGIISGAVFSYIALVKWQCGYKFITSIGFVFTVGYVVFMYFIISPATTRLQLFLPLFCKGTGNIIVYIVLTVYAARTIPFKAFFNVITIFGFARTCLGTPLGTAIVGRAFSITTKKDIMLLGSDFNGNNHTGFSMNLTSLMGELNRQALLVSVKEIFGYASIAGVIILIIALCSRYKTLFAFRIPRFE